MIHTERAMRTRIAAALAAALLAVLLAGCQGKESVPKGEPPEVRADDKVVVYSSRKEDFVEPLLDKFTQDTGIEVEVLHAGDTAVNRLNEEAASVQADIFVSNDAGSLEYLRLRGVLAPLDDPIDLSAIDPSYRAEDGSWFGISARTRVFIYNKDLIREGEMPKAVWELTDPRWKGQFAITRGGNGSMIAHVSALRTQWGDEKTEEWIRTIKENAGAITEGHSDIRKAVGAGEFKFGLVNNYYFHLQLREPTDNNVGVIYPDQGDGEMGAFVNAAGVGIVAGGPNPGAARKFVEWILASENQLAFVSTSLEVPLDPTLEAPDGARSIDSYNVMDMPLRSLGQVWADSRALIEKAGLDLELK